jgi:hypothetical protein
MLGPTTGLGRTAQDFYERHNQPKQLWVRAVDPHATAALKAPELPAPRRQVAAPRLPSLLLL